MSVPTPTWYSATQRFRAVVEVLRDAGVDVPQALGRFGFSEESLLDPATRVPRERIIVLMGHLIWMANSPTVGVLAAERFVLSDLGVLGYLMRHAANALEGLENMVRFRRLIADAADLQVEDQGAQIRVRAGLLGERPAVPPAVDFSVGSLVQSVSELTGGRARLLSADLTRPPPSDLAPYRRLFGKLIRFDAPQAVLVYDAADLRAPTPHADAQLATILAQHAGMLIAGMPEPSAFVDHVRATVERHIERGELALPRVAEELGMSERTLRRRLTQLGTSFRDVIDRARSDRAIICLNEGKLSITEIAYRLGFADATAFTRSFRRWTGKTPAEIVRLRSETLEASRALAR